MKVSVDTTGRSGYLVKHVVIHSNDRVTPTVSVTMIMDVQGADPGGVPKH